jgi:uncharacterized metal-binding protein
MTCRPHSKTMCHLSLFHRGKKRVDHYFGSSAWLAYVSGVFAFFFFNIYSIVIRLNPKQGSKIRPERSTRVYQKYFFFKKYQNNIVFNFFLENVNSCCDGFWLNYSSRSCHKSTYNRVKLGQFLYLVFLSLIWSRPQVNQVAGQLVKSAWFL